MISYTEDTHQRVHQFLVVEAEMLDNQNYQQWLGLFTEDIVYRMPVRVTRAHTLEGSILDDMDHFDEDMYSLKKRVQRFETEHAWTEDPPSRTRHLITNVRAYSDAESDDLRVKSYVLLFRSRGDDRDADFLSAERTDLLRRTDEGFRIARRRILVDESVLRTQNLAVFL